MSLSKKILHVILALALMLTVLPAVSLDVHAEEVAAVTATMTGEPAACVWRGSRYLRFLRLP